MNGQTVDFRHGLDKQESMEFGCSAPMKPQETYADSNIFQVLTLI